MEWDTLVYRLGSLHSLLRQLAAEGRFQGEHTIDYRAADGTLETVHVMIDGTDLQLSHTPGAFRLGFSLDIQAD